MNSQNGFTFIPEEIGNLHKTFIPEEIGNLHETLIPGEMETYIKG